MDSDTSFNFTDYDVSALSHLEEEVARQNKIRTEEEKENVSEMEDTKYCKKFGNEGDNKVDETDENLETDNFDLCNFTVLDECSETSESFVVEHYENDTLQFVEENSESRQIREENLLEEYTEGDDITSLFNKNGGKLFLASVDNSNPNDQSISEDEDLRAEIAGDHLGQCSYRNNDGNTSTNSKVREELYFQIDSNEESKIGLNRETGSHLSDDINIETIPIYQDEIKSAEERLIVGCGVDINEEEFTEVNSKNDNLMSFCIVDSDDKGSEENFEDKTVLLEEVDKVVIPDDCIDTEISDMDDFIVVDSVDNESIADHMASSEKSPDCSVSLTVEHRESNEKLLEDKESKCLETSKFIEVNIIFSIFYICKFIF